MLEGMPFAESALQVARSELERVLASPGFTRNERLGRFLRFVVEKHLEGRDDEIKEYVVAIEVFGRRPDHDPKQDSIVRTEAGRLRARLSEYYLGDGKDDPVIIELPKGRYVPVLRQSVTTQEPTDPSTGRKHSWRRSWLVCGIACILLAAGTAVFWRLQHRNAPISIAVLPLINLSQEPNSDYFADGLTGEIIRDLSIINGLVVRSQTSSFAFKGNPQNVREAGRQLNADYIIEGSVLRAGEQLRINAQLVRVRDDFPLWSGRYDREFTDVFAIQDEISRGIVDSLRLKLGRGRRRYETSTDAYDLYLRARALPLQTGIIGYDDAIPALEAAIAKDPSFAPAYAGLAAAHAMRSGEFRFNLGDEIVKMRAAAEKAIQLDPLLAEAHSALGMAYARDAKWQESEKSFRRAIELDSSASEPRQNFTLFLLWPLGRLQEALKQLRIAERSDPLSVLVHAGLANVLIAGGRYDEAQIECGKIPETGESECLGRVRLGQGKFDQAIQIFTADLNRGLSAGNQVRGYLGFAYGRAGRREEAEKLEAETPAVNPLNHALIFAGLGDKDRTFEALERAAAGGPFRIGRVLTWPELSLLRGDPRLKTLRRKVGLPE
jgi:TolB-like protein